MEMVSVSMMLPFISTIVSPEKVLANETVKRLMGILGIQAYRTFLIFLALIMAALYIIKNLFLLFQMTIQEKFVSGNQFDLQKKLMKDLLARPYEAFLNMQSGEVVRVIMQDTTDAFLVLSTLITLFSELVVSVILLLTILVISPLLTFTMGAILLIVTLSIYIFSKKRLLGMGKKQVVARKEMNQILLQAIQGIKEIKLSNKEAFFQSKYEKNGKVFVRGRYISRFLGLLPRFMLEAVAMSVFFVILAVMIYSGYAMEDLLPPISGLAMAAVRLLPSMNRISSALALLTYNEPVVDKMIENLNNLESTGKECNNKKIKRNEVQEVGIKVCPLTDSFKMENVTYKYPKGHQTIIDHADLTIKKGESVGIVGTSGAGKTTAVDLILGLLKPQEGQILIDGIDIESDMKGWIKQIGYIPQSIFMLDGTIRENVAFGEDQGDVEDEKVWNALKKASLFDYVKSLPDGLDTQIGERGIRISGGQRQRIGIARALYNDPEILFFDEATSALDNDTESVIMDSIKHLQGLKTIVIIAHRLTTIENCDVVYRVQDKQIVKEIREKKDR